MVANRLVNTNKPNSAEFTNSKINNEITISSLDVDDGHVASTEGGLFFRARMSTMSSREYAGYYFGISIKKQQVILEKSDIKTGRWIEIAKKEFHLKYNQMYTLTVNVFDNHVQCFVNRDNDDYPVIDILDDDYSTGSVWQKSCSTNINYGDLVVDDYDERKTTEITYTNPILPSIADPDVLYHSGTYYLYATTPSRNVGGIKVYCSTDLVNWTDKGLAMTMEENWGTSGFWAPDLIERSGKFYMYYTANEHLCVSVSNSPLGPFKQKEYGPLHSNIKEIDANAFLDDDGKYYLYFVRFANGNHIWGARLNDDMLSIDEGTLKQLLSPSQSWEKDMANINEGPFMLKKNDTYYLTYSGSHFESPLYGAGYATSDLPLGEYKKYEQNPIMQSNSLVHGAGHHGIIESPDGKELFIVYHRHQSLLKTDPRQLSIDRMRFTLDDDKDTVIEVFGPTVTPQPIPSGAKDVANFIKFDSKTLPKLVVDSKTDPKTWKLPKRIGIVTTKNSPDKSLMVPVEWDLKIRSDKSRKKLTIYGNVVFPEGIQNIGNLDQKVKLSVVMK